MAWRDILKNGLPEEISTGRAHSLILTIHHLQKQRPLPYNLPPTDPIKARLRRCVGMQPTMPVEPVGPMRPVGPLEQARGGRRVESSREGFEHEPMSKEAASQKENVATRELHESCKGRQMM